MSSPTDSSISTEAIKKPEADRPKASPVTEPDSSKKRKETPQIFNKKTSKEVIKKSPSIIEKKERNFSEADLKKTWKEYAKQKIDASDTEKLVLNKSVKKGDNHAVSITLGSQLEVGFLEKFETDLVQYFREKLENDRIVLNSEIGEVKYTKKLYTSTDIFDHMIKRNPNLKDLKDRLGLDFEY